ncbi:DUF1295 domain-containing protein [Streptomyces sp. NPDC088745]|uniref:DUF1295 domain-containing protein n=1 Tax=Streptomyces sp. NPDC088745 TaxID=3365884 RepID=UPI00381663FC
MNPPDWNTLLPCLVATAAAGAGVLLATFALAVRLGLHRIVDVTWGLAFCAVAVVTFVLSDGHGDEVRRLLVTGATVVWGLRLSLHIVHRSRGHGEDPRYTALLDKAPGSRTWYALRTVYLSQAGLVWLISLPVQLAAHSPAPLGPLDVFAAIVWAAGLTFETVGDHQLARFKADPANRGRVMDQGLWAWTRHPNYFGDALVWWGLYLLACTSWQTGLAGLVSPVVMTLLLTVGSGKRLLEKRMAHRPGFAAYAARTSGFLPRPPRQQPSRHRR